MSLHGGFPDPFAGGQPIDVPSKYPLGKEHVAIIGVREGNIGHAIQERLRAYGAGTISANTDTLEVRDYEAIKSWMTHHGDSLEALVCAQGVIAQQPFLEADPYDIERQVSTNLTGSMLAARAFLEVTKNHVRRRSIVFIGSISHDHAFSGCAAYGASKAALNQLTRQLAWELKGHGVDVFCINPTNVPDTPMTEKVIEGTRRMHNFETREEAEAYWKQSEQVSKEQVADAVAWLMRPEARAMSGACIDLYAGQR